MAGGYITVCVSNLFQVCLTRSQELECEMLTHMMARCRLDEQTLPPSKISERPGEIAEPRADLCKGPQVIFTVEEHPCEDQETLDGAQSTLPSVWHPTTGNLQT